jgi:SPOR domain
MRPCNFTKKGLMSFCIVFLILGIKTMHSQNNLTINEEPPISRMMEIYASGIKTSAPTNPNTGGGASVQIVDGFRIQLMATTDRLKVDNTQTQFAALYPGVFSTWSQAKPYYRVRVGAFSSRTDASNFLTKIKKDYPDAYIVPDRVKTSEMTTN